MKTIKHACKCILKVVKCIILGCIGLFAIGVARACVLEYKISHNDRNDYGEV